MQPEPVGGAEYPEELSVAWLDYAEPNNVILRDKMSGYQPNSERQSMTEKLQGGDAFPSLSLKIVGGGQVSLPDDLESPMTIVLFYRGHW